MSRSPTPLAAFFVLAGSLHFIRPGFYRAIMPPYIPRHAEAVAVSGVAEIAGGLAVLDRRTRPLARWWLIALLVAIFPANIHVAVNPGQIRGLDLKRIPRWTLWARLPLQAAAIWWVWRVTDPERG